MNPVFLRFKTKITKWRMKRNEFKLIIRSMKNNIKWRAHCGDCRTAITLSATSEWKCDELVAAVKRYFTRRGFKLMITTPEGYCDRDEYRKVIVDWGKN